MRVRTDLAPVADLSQILARNDSRSDHGQKLREALVQGSNGNLIVKLEVSLIGPLFGTRGLTYHRMGLEDTLKLDKGAAGSGQVGGAYFQELDDFGDPVRGQIRKGVELPHLLRIEPPLPLARLDQAIGTQNCDGLARDRPAHLMPFAQIGCTRQANSGNIFRRGNVASQMIADLTDQCLRFIAIPTAPIMDIPDPLTRSSRQCSRSARKMATRVTPSALRKSCAPCAGQSGHR